MFLPSVISFECFVKESYIFMSICLSILLLFYFFEARQTRALSVLDLKTILGELSEGSRAQGISAMTHSSVRDAVRSAVELTAAEAHLNPYKSGSEKPTVPVVVVCGTAFIMAEARAELGVQEPRDSESLSDPLSTDENSNVDSQVCSGLLYLLVSDSI
jgi:hypothetical protein